MIIHWVPCYDHRPASWMQPEKDKIIVEWNGRSVAVDFSDAGIVEYDLEPPVLDFIHKAWREDGVLHLVMPSFGRLNESVTIDHGEDRVLTWR